MVVMVVLVEVIVVLVVLMGFRCGGFGELDWKPGGWWPPIR